MSSILDALRKAQNRQRGGDASDRAPERQSVADDAPEGSPASGAGSEPDESAPRQNPRPGPAILVAVAGLAIGALAARLLMGGASSPLGETVETDTPPSERVVQSDEAPEAPEKVAAIAMKHRAERARGGGAAAERRTPKDGKDAKEAGPVGVDAAAAATASPGRASRAETAPVAPKKPRQAREKRAAQGASVPPSAPMDSSSSPPPEPGAAPTAPVAGPSHAGAPTPDRTAAATPAAPAATPPSTPTSATVPAAKPEESPVLEAPPTDAPVVALLFIRWSREPADRVASLRGSGGKLMLVREGDIVEGMRVSEIRPDALELQWRGTRFLLLAAR